MSYLDHFSLEREPFSNSPTERFYYASPQHERAMARLLHVIGGMRGLAILVGQIGHGKTTLARRLLERLPEERYEASLLVIIHSGITASWLLKRVAQSIGVKDPAEEKLDLLGQVYERLLEIHKEGRKAVILVDEAQMLESRELMEEVRGLLNIELPGEKLINFVFFGLPEIERNIKLDPPLEQRVALKYRLDPFDAASTAAYVAHRLRLAGAVQNPFRDGALDVIHKYSGGTPRLVNTLCDNGLLEAFLDGEAFVDGRKIETVARSLGLSPWRQGTQGPQLTAVELDEIDRILESLAK